MADDVVKDDRPTAQVYRLTTFGGGRSNQLRKDLGPYGGKAPDDAVQPNAFEPEDEYQQLYVGATRDQGIVQPPYNPAPARSPQPGEQRARPLHRGDGDQHRRHRLRFRVRSTRTPRTTRTTSNIVTLRSSSASRGPACRSATSASAAARRRAHRQRLHRGAAEPAGRSRLVSPGRRQDDAHAAPRRRHPGADHGDPQRQGSRPSR